MIYQNSQEILQNRSIYPTRHLAPMIQLQNVSLSYEKIKALKDLNLTLNEKEMVFLTGASGAGKTSLLKIISRMIKPSLGVVNYLIDEEITFAHIFQDLILIPYYSIHENLDLLYSAELYGSYQKYQSDKMELLQYFNLLDLAHSKISDLNGGSKQKVAIIRALLTQAKCIIADEPTCSMDENSAQSVFEILNFYNIKRGTTIIWATHDKMMVKKYQGKTIHLENGKLIHSGSACFI
jgi:ABC-type lipoprotein export system ATPase subunit